MKKACCPEKIISQLHRIEGQVRSVEKMYNEKRDIEEIARVVKAARASMDSLSKLLINDKISGCYDGKKSVDKKEVGRLINILFDIT
ncbi:MAG: metal-sensitive transcriptional regulator [Patescibacteria group bacterium]|nr:metal-sensitive transcriptional regulator [Patescibacteria group bacterium]